LHATGHDDDYLVNLVRELCKLTHEAEWIEFKENDEDPQQIGEYVSALSNSAALVGRPNAYVVWGVSNTDHRIVGTSFKPQSTKYGNEELENWLARLLSPKINFCFRTLKIGDTTAVLLEIDRAHREPIRFNGVEYIRVGSYKKKLKDFPEKERALWRIFDTTLFEEGISRERLSAEGVLADLDHESYFSLINRPSPGSPERILDELAADRLIATCEAGGWDITNLGAMLFARRLEDFPNLKRKAMRVIQYPGNNRVETIRERIGGRGYAAGFEGLVQYVNRLLPSSEVIGQALRQEVSVYPELAVRELVANALIHQDFFVSGSGPMVEIFEDRVEITNPGLPLVDTQRFLDTPPRSRNELLASFMRRIGICEERGSGWDKVVFLTEVHQLPAPLAEATGGHTRVTIFGERQLTRMDPADRMRAVYLHACLKYVNREHMTNTSVRQRFGIEPQNTAMASRLIREAIDGGLVLPYDESAAPKLMRYIPVWAASDDAQNT
jgi:ATP-dependent DNA helicase RecG